MKQLLTIQQASKILGVSAKTLRRWEDAGILLPTRTAGNQRRYTFEQVTTFQKGPRIKTGGAIHESPLLPLGILTIILVLLVGSWAVRKFELQGGIENKVRKAITFIKTSPKKELLTIIPQSSVLAAETALEKYILNINVPTIFKQDITAPNVIYSLKAGTGVKIAGGQNPTIDATFTNNDPGSAQKIWKTFKVGSTEISAGSNTDTITFAGSGDVTLSANSSDKKITISATGKDPTTAGWTDDGTTVHLTTLTDTVNLGSSQIINGVTYAFPSAQATASGQVLINNSTGTLTWGNVLATDVAANTLDFSHFKDSMTVDADTVIGLNSKNLTISGSGTLNTVSILPLTNSTYNLGSSSNYWNNLYVNNIFGASSGVSGHWQRNSGVVSPTNITDDLIIGATATTSALLQISGTTNSITTSQSSYNLLNTNATTINFAGAATTLSLGASTGNTTVNNTLNVTGTTNLNGIVTVGDAGDTIALNGTTITLTANLAGNDITANLVDDNTDALDVQQGTNNYININTTNSSEAIQFGNATTNPNYTFLGSGTFNLSSGTLGTSIVNSSLTSVGTIGTGVWQGTKIAEGYGGTNQTTYATGDILYASGVNTLAKRTVGSTGQVLVVSGGVPTWGTISGSTCSDCILTDPSTTQTITPSAATATGLRVAQASSGSVDIFSVTNNGSSTKYLYVDSTGKVVTSTFQMTTGAATGYVLTSDGSGNGSWTNSAGSGSFGSWTLTGSTVYPNQNTYDILVGSTSTADDIGKLNVSGTKTGKALAVFNDTGTDQNILTASASGVTVMNLDRSGNLAIEGAISDLSGSVLTVNDDLATNDLQVNGGDLTTSGSTFNFVTGATTVSIAASTGTTTINNTLNVTGTTNLNGIVTVGDAGDTIALNGTTITLTANGATNDITANLVDNNTDALDIQQGTNNYININTTDTAENISFGNTTTNPSFSFLGSGVINSGTWNGSVVGPVYGGTGVANNAASTLTISGNFATTLTVSGTTGVTLPTSGTLATLAGNETLSNKTLTAPKFADLGFIADASGNEMLIFDSNATAVNQLTITNSATTNALTLAATGDDSTVALSIDSKSTAALNLNNNATGDILIGGGSGSTGCTITNSTGALACSGVITTTATSGSMGWWQRNAQALSPTNITDDLLVGGIATSSAKFQVFGLTGNATTSGTLTFDTTGTIQTTKNQTLTIGGNTTGNIVLNPLNGSGLVNIGNITDTTGVATDSESILAKNSIRLIADGLSSRIRAFSYGVNGANTNVPVFIGHTARGSLASPTAINADDPLVRFSGRGYNGTTFVNGGFLALAAEENYSGTNTGTYLTINLTTPGTTQDGGSERLRVGGAGIITLSNNDANTSTATDNLIVKHNSSGTAAAGFGSNTYWQLESSTTDSQDAAKQSVFWTTATHATRTSAMTWQLVNSASSLTEYMRLTPTELTVVGNATASGNLTLYGAARTIQTTANNTLTIGGSTTGNIVLSPLNNLSSGRVGIGTTNPKSELHILKSDSAATSFAFDSSTLLGLQATDATTSDVYLGMVSGNAANTWINFGDSDNQFTGGIRYDHSTDSMTLRAGANNTVSIVGSNLGVGDSTPDAKIESLSTGEQLRLTYTDDSVDSRFAVDSSGDLTINNTGTQTIIADDLQVQGGDLTTNQTTATLFNTTATTLSLGGAATTLNIGVGTANNTINIGTGGSGADTLNLGNATSTTALNFTSGTGSQTFASAVATGTTTTSAFVNTANSLTSGTAIYDSSTSITTGKLLDITTGSANTWTGNGTTNGLVDISSSSTAGTASAADILLNLSRSGANSNTAHTAYGLYSNVTNTNATSGTNIAGYFSASGATTANYGLIVANGNVGIGTTAPTNNLSFTGQSAQKMWMERHTTANTGGNTLTIEAGGATSGGTDKAGGSLNLNAGVSTGTGVGGNGISLRTYAAALTGAVSTINSSPTAAGSGYTANDVLTLTGGSANATVTVTSVDGSGAVTGLSLTSGGTSGYSVSTGNATSGGTGTGCTVRITAITSTTDNTITTRLFVRSNAFDAVRIGSGASNTNALLELRAGSTTKGAPGLNNGWFSVEANTLTDNSTLDNATAANAGFSSFMRPTLAAVNASVTTTDAANVYIQNDVAAGTNMTLTRSWALWVDAGNSRFDSNVGIGTTTPRAFLDVVNNSTATASAMIQNSSTTAATVGLAIQMSATTLDTTSRFINFLDKNGTIIGKINAANTTTVAYSTNGTDFAEYFVKDGSNPTVGDIVSVSSGSATLTTTAYDPKMIGVVSNTAGFVGGNEEGNKILVGLVGQVPIKIASTSGTINKGDFITSSSEAGRGMKATKPGFVIGKALEDWNPANPTDTILIYINNIWADPNQNLAFDESGNLAVNDITLTHTTLVPTPTLGEDIGILKDQIASISAQLATLNIQSASPSADLSHLSILGDATISGKLIVSGTSLLSDTNITGKLKVGILEIDDLSAKLSSLTGKITVSGDLAIENGTLKVLGTSAGRATIPAGNLNIAVSNSLSATTSAIFATPIDNPVPIASSATQAGEFILTIPATQSADLQINWWIVN